MSACAGASDLDATRHGAGSDVQLVCDALRPTVPLYWGLHQNEGNWKTKHPRVGGDLKKTDWPLDKEQFETHKYDLVRESLRGQSHFETVLE